MDADYEMLAKFKGAVSDTKKLSMYDSRKHAVRNFVIPTKAAPGDRPAAKEASKDQP